jgi:hypothetical protein
MKSLVTLAATLAITSGAHASEVRVERGTATMTFNLPAFLGQTPLDTFNAAFGITETRTEVLSGLPGNNPGPAVTWALNAPGTPSPAGRQIQGTTLEIDPADLFGTWAAASDIGPFLFGGEQIGFGGMTRWTLDPGIPGILLFGDWGIRYSPVRAGTFAGQTANIRSGLVITSNIDFPDATFVDIGNASISVNGRLLTITGDLLISDGLIVLGFPESNLGLNVGRFRLTARLAPIPTDWTLDPEALRTALRRPPR